MMNPETNKLEVLNEVPNDKLNDELNKLSEGLTLIRPNGEPIPKHWSIFTVGELIVIKDYTFRVAYINESTIVFEPVKPTDAIIAPQ